MKKGNRMSKQTLTLGSKNPGKLKEYREILIASGWKVVEVGDQIEEPEEIGDSFKGISELKSNYYARGTRRLAIAEDAGLVVPSLSGSPGIFSARFSDCTLDPKSFAITGYNPSGKSRSELDLANNLRLLKLLEGMSKEQREAYFVVHISVARPNGEIVFSEEFRLEGKIIHEARGENGFGYDFIFEANETPGQTTSELSSEQKNAISHRGKGIVALNKWLEGFVE